MGAVYTPISVDDFKKLLTAEKGWLQRVEGKEYVWEYRVNSNKKILIRVYSSIAVGTNVSREAGGDAIRVVGLLMESEKSMKVARPLLKADRIHRTKNWQTRLRMAIIDAIHTSVERSSWNITPRKNEQD